MDRTTSESVTSCIRLRGITRSFPMGETEFHALRGIDLDIAAGEFVAIIGPSGSGKSTLMYLLGCLDQPTRGTYELGGREVSGLDDRELSRIRNEDIGFVFQQYHLLPDLNVAQNLALGLVYGGVPVSRRRALAERFAERIGLGQHLDHTPSELSGGQMQRVAIARALSCRPRLILADEPTGNLDSVTGREILDLIRELHRQGHTVILVTHDSNVAALAQRIITLADGRIVRDERTTTAAPAAAAVPPDLDRFSLEENFPRSRVAYRDVTRIAMHEGLLARKARTFLTMLGIVFGIAAVIAMNGITEGGKRKQLEQIRQIGMNNIQVRDKELEGARLLRERRRNPTGVNRCDLRALKEYLPEIQALCAWKAVKAELRCGDQVLESEQVLGVEGDFIEVADFYPQSGRFLQAHDNTTFARVCVIGQDVARKLGLGAQAVGKWIVIGDESFRVVGVMAAREFGGSDVKDLGITDRNLDIYMPYTSMRTYFKRDAHESEYDVISLRMRRDDGLVATAGYLHKIIARLHNEADDFEVSVPLEKIRQAQQTKEVFNIIIVVIAAISLIVGGIGIMNIMLANVTERTREIGIRRAVGATRKDILNQFVTEAILISAAGGLLGLLAGIAAGKTIEMVFAFPVDFSVTIMVVAIVVSTLVGLIFGIYPAWLAARMDPVEALRAG